MKVIAEGPVSKTIVHIPDELRKVCSRGIVPEAEHKSELSWEDMVMSRVIDWKLKDEAEDVAGHTFTDVVEVYGFRKPLFKCWC